MREMAKHSFNADDTSEAILVTVDLVLRDKTEFLNRLISVHGHATIQLIAADRQRVLHEALELRDDAQSSSSSKSPDHVPGTHYGKGKSRQKP